MAAKEMYLLLKQGRFNRHLKIQYYQYSSAELKGVREIAGERAEKQMKREKANCLFGHE
jgi:hypothetical protein